MSHSFYELLQANPIIAAVRSEEEIYNVLESPSKIVFILKGNINTLNQHVGLLKNKNKIVLLHFDLLLGLSKDFHGLEFISKNIKIDGVITTRPNIIEAAKGMDLYAIQRVFLLDTMSLESGIESINKYKADAVEVIPGLMPNVIQFFSENTQTPIITGGLIKDKDDVINALSSGATAISSSEIKVWYL